MHSVLSTQRSAPRTPNNTKMKRDLSDDTITVVNKSLRYKCVATKKNSYSEQCVVLMRLSQTRYHGGWTRLRCKVMGFPPAAPPAFALPSAGVVVTAAAATAGFKRLASESSVATSPSSRVLFAAAPMMATPPALAAAPEAGTPAPRHALGAAAPRIPMFPPRTAPRPRPRAGRLAPPAAAPGTEGLRVIGPGAPPRAGADVVGDGTEDGAVVDGDLAGGADADGVDSPGTTPAFFHSSICNSSSLTLFCARTSCVSFSLNFIVPSSRPLSTAFSMSPWYFVLSSASLAAKAAATAASVVAF